MLKDVVKHHVDFKGILSHLLIRIPLVPTHAIFLQVAHRYLPLPLTAMLNGADGYFIFRYMESLKALNIMSIGKIMSKLSIYVKIVNFYSAFHVQNFVQSSWC